jgi:hypothetical protein
VRSLGKQVGSPLEPECRIVGSVLLQRYVFPPTAAIVDIEDQQFTEYVRPLSGGNVGQDNIDFRPSPGFPCGLELVANSIVSQDVR